MTAVGFVLAACLWSPAVYAAPAPAEGNCTLHDFRFNSGETLPELRLHYTTLGTPVKDEAGVVRNAVLILHGTSGDGKTPFPAGDISALNPVTFGARVCPPGGGKE